MMRRTTPPLALLVLNGACSSRMGLRWSPLKAAKLALLNRLPAAPLCLSRHWYRPSRYSLRLSKYRWLRMSLQWWQVADVSAHSYRKQ